MKDNYMLTVIYTGGRVVDIEFQSKEDRKAFLNCIKDTAGLKFTVWDKGVEE